MVDLRCFEISDGGSCWIIRCRRCAAGWLPPKCRYDPAPIIDHAMTHARKSSRIEQLRRQLAAITAARLGVEFDLLLPAAAAGSGEKLRLERTTYDAWYDAVDDELRGLRGSLETKKTSPAARRRADALASQAAAIIPASPSQMLGSARHATRGPYRAAPWHKSIAYMHLVR